jgi:WbqC-like protein family
MPSILIESQFFPPIDYLARCAQKGSYRNRCHIAGANGLQVLSVPLRRNGKDAIESSKDSIKNGLNNVKNGADNIENDTDDIRSIKNVRISYDVDWQKQHWRTLQTAYGSAPFWDFYAPVFERFFHQRFDYLLDYNVEILKAIFKLLKIEKTVNISLSTTYESIYTEGSDLRNTLHPKTPHPANAVPYSQLFNDRYAFMPHLSILDVLFCCGNQSLSILKNTTFDSTE